MAQAEVKIVVTGLWRLRLCRWLMKAVALVLRMSDLFIPRPSRREREATIIFDITPQIRQVS